MSLQTSLHSAASGLSFSFRAPAPLPTAAGLLAEIRERGGRVYRMRSDAVFCLTDSAEVASWLLDLGARPFAKSTFQDTPGAYRRAPGGKIEYDLWLTAIPVDESGTLWEAAA